MDHYGQGQQAASNTLSAQVGEKASRIHSDIERILDLTKSVNRARDRVFRQTSALGYFADTPSLTEGANIKPISNTLQSAITELDRAVDGLSAALALFE